MSKPNFKGISFDDMGPSEEYPEPVVFIFTNGIGLDVQISDEVIRQVNLNIETMKGLLGLPDILRDAIGRVLAGN